MIGAQQQHHVSNTCTRSTAYKNKNMIIGGEKAGTKKKRLFVSLLFFLRRHSFNAAINWPPLVCGECLLLSPKRLIPLPLKWNGNPSIIEWGNNSISMRRRGGGVVISGNKSIGRQTHRNRNKKNTHVNGQATPRWLAYICRFPCTLFVWLYLIGTWTAVSSGVFFSFTRDEYI